jgi:hypothetical protein
MTIERACKNGSVPEEIARRGHIIQTSWIGRWKSIRGRESDGKASKSRLPGFTPVNPKIEAVAN